MNTLYKRFDIYFIAQTIKTEMRKKEKKKKVKDAAMSLLDVLLGILKRKSSTAALIFAYLIRRAFLLWAVHSLLVWKDCLELRTTGPPRP